MNEQPTTTNLTMYRIIDISSIDEVAKRWNTKVFKKRDMSESVPKAHHRADDKAKRAMRRL